MTGRNTTPSIGYTLVAKSPGCCTADYIAPAKSMLINIEFRWVVKPGANWKFCNRFCENIWLLVIFMVTVSKGDHWSFCLGVVLVVRGSFVDDLAVQITCSINGWYQVTIAVVVS